MKAELAVLEQPIYSLSYFTPTSVGKFSYTNLLKACWEESVLWSSCSIRAESLNRFPETEMAPQRTPSSQDGILQSFSGCTEPTSIMVFAWTALRGGSLQHSKSKSDQQNHLFAGRQFKHILGSFSRSVVTLQAHLTPNWMVKLLTRVSLLTLSWNICFLVTVCLAVK